MSLAIVASDIHDSWGWPDDLMHQNWTTWALGKHFWLSINNWLFSCEQLSIDHLIWGTLLSLIVFFLFWYPYIMCNGRLFCANPQPSAVQSSSTSEFLQSLPVQSEMLFSQSRRRKASGSPALYPECWLYLHLGHVRLWWVVVKKTRESTFFFFLFLIHTDKGLNRLLNWETERREGVFIHLLWDILCLTKLFTIH